MNGLFFRGYSQTHTENELEYEVRMNVHMAALLFNLKGEGDQKGETHPFVSDTDSLITATDTYIFLIV